MRAIGRDDIGVDHRLKKDAMESAPLFDCAGRRRSPATLSSCHQDRAPRNKACAIRRTRRAWRRPSRSCAPHGEQPGGIRLRGMIVVLWRAGRRISETLALAESDLDRSRGAVLVRRGNGGKRREVGMDRWG